MGLSTALERKRDGGKRATKAWRGARQRNREKEEREREWKATPRHGVQAYRGVTRSCFNPTQREQTATPRETNQGATTVSRSLRGVDRCLIAKAEPNSPPFALSSRARTDDNCFSFLCL